MKKPTKPLTPREVVLLRHPHAVCVHHANGTYVVKVAQASLAALATGNNSTQAWRNAKMAVEMREAGKAASDKVAHVRTKRVEAGKRAQVAVRKLGQQELARRLLPIATRARAHLMVGTPAGLVKAVTEILEICDEVASK